MDINFIIFMYFFHQQMYQWDKEQIKVSMYNINNKYQTTILIILVCYIIYHVNGQSLSNSSTAHLGMLSGLGRDDGLIPSSTSKHILAPLGVRFLKIFWSRESIMFCISLLLHNNLCLISFFF